jgi:cation:H+ antiporter
VLLNLLFLLAGLVFLYYGAEWLIRGAVGLALARGVTKLVIGLTVVAFGTSTPELVVSAFASVRGANDIAVGNIVGSNIANVALILGLSAAIAPLIVQVSTVKRELPIMIGGGILLTLMAWTGTIAWYFGLFLLACLLASTWFSYSSSKKESGALPAGVEREYSEELDAAKPRRGPNLFWIAIGLTGLLIGAELLVRGSTGIARHFGLSERLIGLTIVALGTSLPELATSTVAVAKKEVDIAVGNVVGSSIFNIFGIMGFASLVSPIKGAERFIGDLVVMVAYSLALLPILISGFRITRVEGLLLLITYIAYLIWIIAAG